MGEPAEGPPPDEGRDPDQPDEQPAWRQGLEPVLTFHWEHPIYFWLSAMALVGGLFAIGAVLAPEIFLEWLWTHIWGPTAADANQAGIATRYGITVNEDYTLTSEVVYGLILAGALTSLYVHLFKKRGIDVDGRFIASLLPYILFGPTARALEDASVFCELGTEALRSCDPGLFSWFFISPFIYLLTAAAVVVHILLAYRTSGEPRESQFRIVAAWMGVQVAVYAAILFGFRDQFVVVAPALPTLGLGPSLTGQALGLLGNALVIGLVSLGLYWLARRRGGRHQTWAVAAWGLPWILIPSALIARWALVEPWFASIRPPAPEAVPVVLGLTMAVVAVLVLIAIPLRRDAPTFGSFLTPLNIGLIAGHMVDGFATFTAICSNPGGICSGAGFLGVETQGYGEKHPVSEVFLSGFQVDWGIPLVDTLVNALGSLVHDLDGWGFPLMKLLLVTVIVVLIDRSAREGGEDPTLVGLVKLAVLVLGLGPGVRDVVRVAMGV